MIKQAAIRLKDGRVFTGKRHCYIINNYREIDFRNQEQGFVDENGKFYNRKKALIHAIKNNQVDKNVSRKYLLSEDLY